MKKGLRRLAALTVTTLFAIPALAAVASATSAFSFDRLQGNDRYATSVATAASYGASTNVILASGVPGHFPDALTASYLAGFKKAPIMLTQLAATPANVLVRIAAAGATDVWLIGGTGVISAAQEAALDVAYTVHRVSGLDRYLTSAAVIGAAGVAAPTTHTAVLATGVNFPDALGGGALSYVKGMPMAITATNTLPAATLSALRAAGVTNVIALGGPTVITSAVINALAAQGITLNRRVYGADRAETSAKLADYMIASQGFSTRAVNVASGYAFGGGADALGAAALSGKENRPTLITDSATVVGPGILAFLRTHFGTITAGHIFGGTGAVSAASVTAMTTAARAAILSPAAGTCSLNAKLVPSCGALWGVYTKPTGSEGWAQPVTSLEQSTGRTFDLVKRYHDWSNSVGNGQFPDKFEQALGANGQRLLDFSWVSNIYSTGGHVMWADIAAGKYDSSVILPEAARLKAWAQPVFMDFDHEMDGATRTGDGTTADYVAAYRHIHEVMAKAGVTNVVWVWTPTGSMGNITRIAAMYPGDAYVDWIGYDPYNFYTCHSTSWQSPDVTFNRFYSWLMNNGHGNKPFMLGEYGSVATSTATGAWYGSVVPALKDLPNIKAAIQWNSGTSTACDFRVMTQPTILTGFAQAGLDPYVNVRP